jgi:hypothetical protein
LLFQLGQLILQVGDTVFKLGAALVGGRIIGKPAAEASASTAAAPSATESERACLSCVACGAASEAAACHCALSSGACSIVSGHCCSPFVKG